MFKRDDAPPRPFRLPLQTSIENHHRARQCTPHLPSHSALKHQHAQQTQNRRARPPPFRNYRSLVALADYVVAAIATLEDAYSRITLPPGFGEVDKIMFCKRRVHRKTRFRNRRFGKPSSIQRLCLDGPRIPRRRPYDERELAGTAFSVSSLRLEPSSSGLAMSVRGRGASSDREALLH